MLAIAVRRSGLRRVNLSSGAARPNSTPRGLKDEDIPYDMIMEYCALRGLYKSPEVYPCKKRLLMDYYRRCTARCSPGANLVVATRVVSRRVAEDGRAHPVWWANSSTVFIGLLVY